jgi:hypothetical protein
MNFVRDNLIVKGLLNLPIFNLVFWCLMSSYAKVSRVLGFSAEIKLDKGYSIYISKKILVQKKD